jgi:hypothetical protein
VIFGGAGIDETPSLHFHGESNVLSAPARPITIKNQKPKHPTQVHRGPSSLPRTAKQTTNAIIGQNKKFIMTQLTLAIGSGCLAFGPLASLFIVVVYPKAIHVILLTSAALFGLLAATAAGLFHTALTWLTMGRNSSSPILAIFLGIFFQFIFRCIYVSCYHKVEMVVLDSLLSSSSSAHANANYPGSSSSPSDDHDNDAANNNEGGSRTTTTTGPQQKLALNDTTSAIASAVGFGGMQATLLYGSLWASQFNTLGVLYQDFCPLFPSLAVSAVATALISILQVFWMLLTFVGLRRRLLYGRGQGIKWESRTGGNLALLMALGTHLLVGGVSYINTMRNGCYITIPALVVILFITAFAFWAGCGRTSLILPGGGPRRGGGETHRD